MSFDNAKTYKKAKAIANKNDCIYMQDIIDLLGAPSRSTFYTMFPEGSDELDALKDQIAKNRALDRVETRGLMKRSKNASERIAYYKLVALPEELDALNNKTITVNTTDDETAPQKVAFGDV